MSSHQDEMPPLLRGHPVRERRMDCGRTGCGPASEDPLPLAIAPPGWTGLSADTCDSAEFGRLSEDLLAGWTGLENGASRRTGRDGAGHRRTGRGKSRTYGRGGPTRTDPTG